MASAASIRCVWVSRERRAVAEGDPAGASGLRRRGTEYLQCESGWARRLNEILELLFLQARIRHSANLRMVCIGNVSMPLHTIAVLEWPCSQQGALTRNFVPRRHKSAESRRSSVPPETRSQIVKTSFSSGVSPTGR
ncbi:hypothetical protein ACFPRL_15605 [Pseudoclavibacter helvolus]